LNQTVVKLSTEKGTSEGGSAKGGHVSREFDRVEKGGGSTDRRSSAAHWVEDRRRTAKNARGRAKGQGNRGLERIALACKRRLRGQRRNPQNSSGRKRLVLRKEARIDRRKKGAGKDAFSKSRKRVASGL